MAATDPVIRWETEALRESAARRRSTAPSTPDRPHSHRKADWVTLRDAHYETGLPIETLRKWARRNHIPSEMRRTDYGDRRMVDLLAVEERARSLGRPLNPVPEHLREPPDADHEEAIAGTVVESAPARPDQEAAPADAPTAPTEAAGTGTPVVDLREPETAEPAAPPLPSAAASPETSAAAETPPGTMIVPIAAWDRMLMQLGNLHQAGQQLAEARERAAKAETEATFLRERLAELRAQLEPTPEASPPDPVATEPNEAAEPMWRYIVRGWRTRRK